MLVRLTFKQGWVVGANIIWQPVRQLRMGWEVNETHGAAGGVATDGENYELDTEALQQSRGTPASSSKKQLERHNDRLGKPGRVFVWSQVINCQTHGYSIGAG